MMNLPLLKSIPRRTLIIHLSWLGVLLLFAAAALWPMGRSVISRDSEIREIQYQVDEQKNLQPLYQALKTRSQAKPTTALPSPQRDKLSRDLVVITPSTLRRIADNASLKTQSVAPDVSSLTNQSKSLIMNMVVRGDFMNFRKFLIGIGELPYLERCEEIEIRKDPAFMEYRIKIRLALA